MKRGIIVSPKYTYVNGVTEAEAAIRTSDLWFYLTYWDQVLIPQFNTMFPIGLQGNIGNEISGQYIVVSQLIEFDTPDNSNLSGIPGYIPPNPFKEIALLCHRFHESSEPGKWSLGRPRGATDATFGNDATSVRSIEIELYDLLPIPGPDVSLAEIIEFRTSRQPELLALRDAIDDLSRELANSADLPRHKTGAIRRLEHSIKELTEAAKASWTSSIILRAWSAFDMGAVVGGIAGYAYDGIELATTVTLLQGAVNFLIKPRTSNNSPYQYIHDLPLGRRSHENSHPIAMLRHTDQSSKDGNVWSQNFEIKFLTPE